MIELTLLAAFLFSCWSAEYRENHVPLYVTVAAGLALGFGGAIQ